MRSDSWLNHPSATKIVYQLVQTISRRRAAAGSLLIGVAAMSRMSAVLETACACKQLSGIDLARLKDDLGLLEHEDEDEDAGGPGASPDQTEL